MSQSPADVNSDIAIFNPRPSIQEVRLTADHSCLIVDDALVNPEALVQFACAHRDEFGTSQYAYPGIELPMPADFTDRLEAFFRDTFAGRSMAAVRCNGTAGCRW